MRNSAMQPVYETCKYFVLRKKKDYIWFTLKFLKIYFANHKAQMWKNCLD